MGWREHARDLAKALAGAPDLNPTVRVEVPRTVFLGSGDSLSSALLAVPYGARALSAGDVTWTGEIPVGATTVVGISHSGSSAATVRAVELARQRGLRTVAITSAADSPLATAAEDVQLVPALTVPELVPVRGHLMLAIGVAGVCGQAIDGVSASLSQRIAKSDGFVQELIDRAPAAAVDAVSVLTLPELRGAGDFWMLKLIEATGVSVRALPLEESGHVDYFIGPGPNLVLELIGQHGTDRFARLGEALTSTGQFVQPIPLGELSCSEPAQGMLELELLGAIVGSLYAEGVALRWGRPLFRGGAVNMDASHIQLEPTELPA